MSVLVPLFNHARFIEACLESVRDESYPRLELLVLDDGSSDDSYTVARRWGERHGARFERFLLERQENRGVTATLNRLVSLARGDFVTPLASDDLLLPGGIAARVAALEERPERLAVFGDAAVIGEDGTESFPSALRRLGADPRALAHPDLLAGELIFRWAVPGPVLLARREAYREGEGVGPYDEALVIEDRDFYLRLLSRGALGFAGATVAAYRLRAESPSPGRERLASLFESLRRSDRRNAPRFRGLLRTALRLSALRHRGSRDSLAGKRSPGARLARFLVERAWRAAVFLWGVRVRWRLRRSREPPRVYHESSGRCPCGRGAPREDVVEQGEP